MLLNNVRYSLLVHLMMVTACGAVMLSVQTFDSPAGRTSIITVLILIKGQFSFGTKWQLHIEAEHVHVF